MQLHGVHHLTAITAKATQNLAFYTGTLGLRLVKKTVNQDDTSAYHLFYADGRATPGTDITFFDWPAAQERRGSRSVIRTGFRVGGPDALTWWQARFREQNVAAKEIVEIDGRAALPFEDFEGQRLILVDDGVVDEAHPWAASPVPAEHQIRGLGPILMSVPELTPTEAVLTKVMNMRLVRDYTLPEDAHQHVHVFKMAGRGPGSELHVIVQPDVAPARQGAGGVHHVAFRTPDAAEYGEWGKRLNALRIPNSGPIDRFYFRSLYFREPGGVLFEIATDGPGFATDEPLEALGERLSLPPFLEPQRAQIEQGLKAL